MNTILAFILAAVTFLTAILATVIGYAIRFSIILAAVYVIYLFVTKVLM